MQIEIAGIMLFGAQNPTHNKLFKIIKLSFHIENLIFYDNAIYIE